jgi:hypothetical protein
MTSGTEAPCLALLILLSFVPIFNIRSFFFRADDGTFHTVLGE